MIERTSKDVARLSAAVRLAASQLWHARGRAAFAVLGIALAVLLMTTLTGLGYGMATTSEEALTYIEQDVWVSAGPVSPTPGTIGGVKNPLLDAHAVAREIESQPGVEKADAIAFQTVYLSPNGSEFRTVVGVGMTGDASQIGGGFDQSDIHYANGSYDGPRTNAIILDPSTADRLNVSPGDTVHVGGTIAEARETEYTVVSTDNTFTTFLGSPTVVMHLSELQEAAGTTGTDRAALIAVTISDGAAVGTVQERIRRAHPELTVRTREQQLRAVVADQGAVLASAVTLVTLALITGTALVATVLAMLVAGQRRALAALRATGIRRRTLLAVVGSEGALLGITGAAVGLTATPVTVRALNRLVERAVGFPDLIVTPPWVFAIGGGLAIGMGLAGATVAGWRVARLHPLAHLE